MTSTPGQVDRCACVNVTFREMQAHVERHGGDVETLRARLGCARGCGMCLPYICAMLVTGRVAFAVDDPALGPHISATPPRQPPV